MVGKRLVERERSVGDPHIGDKGVFARGDADLDDTSRRGVLEGERDSDRRILGESGLRMESRARKGGLNTLAISDGNDGLPAMVERRSSRGRSAEILL